MTVLSNAASSCAVPPDEQKHNKNSKWILSSAFYVVSAKENGQDVVRIEASNVMGLYAKSIADEFVTKYQGDPLFLSLTFKESSIQATVERARLAEVSKLMDTYEFNVATHGRANCIGYQNGSFTACATPSQAIQLALDHI